MPFRHYLLHCTHSNRHQHGRASMAALGALLVVMLSLAIAYWLLSEPPRVERRPLPATLPPSVEVMRVEQTIAAPVTQGYGRVIAARETDIATRVAGRLIGFAESVEPGLVVEANAPLAHIDDLDFQLALRSARATLAQAESELAIERGEQIRAEGEYRSFGRDLPAERRALVLREPQLKAAQASVASAQAAVESAQLDLQRTEITAPYRGMIQERLVGPGSEVSANTALLNMVDVSHFWVRVSLSNQALTWLDSGNDGTPGAKVKLTSRGWPAGTGRQGHVFSVLPSLEENGLMAQLLVRVDDPLALKVEGPALRLGDVLKATFEATPREGLISLPTRALRPGDRVWTLDSQDRLHITTVEVVHHGDARVLIDAGTFTMGERIITSPLSQPREGMPLRVVADEESTP